MNRETSRSPFLLPTLEHWPPALRFLLKPYSFKTRVVVGILITLMLVAVSYFDKVSGDRIDFKPFYGFIILVAFTFFRFNGIWWLLGVVFSYQLNISLHRLHPSSRLEVLDDLIAFVSFGIIGILITSIAEGLRQLQESQEVLRRDLKLAGEMQHLILPNPVALPWLRVDGRLRSTGEVGGDFYVTESLRDDRLFFAIGDVQGKGVAAALTMAKIMVLIAELAKQGKNLSHILAEANTHLCMVEQGMVTVFAGIISRDPAGEFRMQYVKAGHENGILIKPDGRFRELLTTGLPLGVMPHEIYEAASLTLEAFDRILLYTDGLVDARNADGVVFGRETLVERATALTKNVSRDDVSGWLDLLLNEVESYRGNRAQEDDMAALGLVVLPF